MVEITAVVGREILDSRGVPTVEAEVTLSDGSVGRASVPSGKSVGKHEVVERRDHVKARYFGQSVEMAVAAINTDIQAGLLNNDPFDQAANDSELVLRDGTSDLHRLGANAILSVSLALCRAAAQSQGMPLYHYVGHLAGLSREPHQLPIPLFNILNGGAHTSWQSTDFQEFMFVPHSASSFAQALEWGSETYHALGELLNTQGLSTQVGDEGGYAPAIKSNQEAIELVLRASEKAQLKPGGQISLALDVAASELWQGRTYHFKVAHKTYSPSALSKLYQELIATYPIRLLEDPLAEDEWEQWHELHGHLAGKTKLVGDDLLTTAPERVKRAIAHQACDVLLVKLNQIGTLTEALTAIKTARQAGWQIVVSHRSGETEDTFIADLAVGVHADYVKMGAPARGERTAKYNQLLRIEEQLLSI